MHYLVLVLIVVTLAMAGCSDPESDFLTDFEDLQKEAMEVQEPGSESDADGAWFLSEARPVNRSCNEPGYRSGQPDTYPALHMPTYPVIQDKQQSLAQALKALAQQVTDEDVYDLEADHRIRHEMNVLSQLVFVTAQDLTPRYLLSVCDPAAYEADECAAMQRILQGTLILEDVVQEGASLRFTAQLPSDGSQATLTIANRDLDGLKMTRYSPVKGQYVGEWTRELDGTESFSATSSSGTFSYTERPDCSGIAKALQVDAGGHPWELSWLWSSVLQPENFSIRFTECKVNGLNERECVSGVL